MDLSKAFDTVHHARILDKLPAYGVTGVELSWFTDYLFNREQIVKVEDILSEPCKITHGVPQGSILGPLLFSLLINDLSTTLSRCKLILYADDTVLYFADRDPIIIQNTLNYDANKISSWFLQNNLFLNLKKGKTEFLLFGTPQKLKKLPKIQITINGVIVNEVVSYKYLGVILDKHLNLHLQIHQLCKSTSSKIKLLKRIRSNISANVATTIYTSMVKPKLLYCSILYLSLSDHHLNRLEAVQSKALSVINGNNSHVTFRSISSCIKQGAMLEVFKCVNGHAPSQFEDYFEILNHCFDTRGNNNSLRLPKIRTETGKRSFKYQGASIFNELLSELINERSIVLFRQKVKTM